MQVTELAATRARHHLLDVREQDEWDAGHIDGAQHIPLGQLAQRLAEMPTALPVVAVCRSGHRSGIAAKGLSARGIATENLEGGMEAWAKAGLPMVASGDAPARVI